MQNSPAHNGQTKYKKPSCLLQPLSQSSGSSGSISDEEPSPGAIKTLEDVTDEEDICVALGIIPLRQSPSTNGDYWTDDIEKEDTKQGKDGVSNFYDLVPNPDADEVDLSVLRGDHNPQITAKEQMKNVNNVEESDDLMALAELVPNVITTSDNGNQNISPRANQDDQHNELIPQNPKKGDKVTRPSTPVDHGAIQRMQSNVAQKGEEIKIEDINKDNHDEDEDNGDDGVSRDSSITALKDADVGTIDGSENDDQKLGQTETNEQDISGFDVDDRLDDRKTPIAKGGSTENMRPEQRPSRPRPSGLQKYPSVNTISSATVSTHEVRMPMYLPTFKPATGCTNASDFIVRCFVARLRSGINVVKHGRSRWAKSRVRILHVHQDGRSLSWKPALGEPTSSKRPPKLDLSTCMEVRHAWSPDPLFPLYTGTPILRLKCEAPNAHKSFALIFPKRTVDITAVTADQCKVLMEGFSALCFRLQVANLAGQGQAKERNEESDAEKTTSSNTLTNNSGTGNNHTASLKNKHS